MSEKTKEKTMNKMPFSAYETSFPHLFFVSPVNYNKKIGMDIQKIIRASASSQNSTSSFLLVRAVNVCVCIECSQFCMLLFVVFWQMKQFCWIGVRGAGTNAHLYDVNRSITCLY